MKNDVGTWATRITMLIGMITVISMLMLQAQDKGVMVTDIKNNKDRNTLLEKRAELRDVKFDTFLVQQTKKNTIDSMNTVVLMKFLEKQIEFNGVVQEHIIKAK